MLRVWNIALLLLIGLPLQAQLYVLEEGALNSYTGLQKPSQLLFESSLAIYYPDGFESIAGELRNTSLRVLQEYEQMLDYRLNGRLEIWLTHWKQGTAGKNESTLNTLRTYPTTGGGFATVDHKRLRLIYKGSEYEMYKDLRKAIAEVMVQELLYGVSVAEKARNTAYLQFPQWFTKGLILYLAEGWTHFDDNFLRDRLNDKISRFKHLREWQSHPTWLKSNWHYLVESRGVGALARMVYLAKLTKSIESALYYVMNLSYSEFSKDAELWHAQRYLKEKKSSMPGRLIALPQKHGRYKVISMQQHAGSTWIALQQENGISIWKYDPELQWQKIRIFRRATEFHFVASSGGGSLFFLVRNDDGYRLRGLDSEIPFHWNAHLRQFTHILDLSIEKAGTLWVSGYTGENYSDIYSIDITGNIKRITMSPEPELDILLNTSGQLFWVEASISDTVKQAIQVIHSIKTWKNDSNYALFSMAGIEIYQLLWNEKVGRISFCSDLSGISNAYFLDSAGGIPHALTDYARSIFFQSESGSDLAEILQYQGKWVLSLSEINSQSQSLKLSPTITTWMSSRQERISAGKSHIKMIAAFPEELRKPEALPFYFQSEFPVSWDTLVKTLVKAEVPSGATLNGIALPALSVREVYSRVDNGLLGISRQNPLISPNVSMRYSFGLLGGGQWSDISGQRSLLMAIRVQTQFNGNDQYLQYDRRLDNSVLGMSFYRSSYRSGAFLKGYERFNTLQVTSCLRRSLRGGIQIEMGLMARRDERIQLITEEVQLNAQESVYNEAVLGILQLRHLNKNTSGELRSVLQFRTEAGWAQNPLKAGSVMEAQLLGIKQVHWSHSTRLLLRTRAASSFGHMKTVFVSGGVPNWINQRYRSNLSMLMADAFSVSVVPHLRGVSQNTRNGNSYVNLQAEVDWKILGLMFQRPLLKPLWRELRLGIYSDAGAAWYGMGPYDSKNPLFIKQIQAPGLDIILYQRRNPFMWTHGCMLSFPLYGYQINYYLGRGYEDSRFQPWVHSLSLGFEW